MKSLVLIAALVAACFAQAKESKSENILKQVRATPEYLHHVAGAQMQRGTFTCGKLEEVLVSKNYSRIRGEVSKFALALLKCTTDLPDDGEDPYVEMGLATIDSHGAVVNFKTAYFTQPD